MMYDEQSVQEQAPQTVGECVSPKDRAGVTWINVDGLHETEGLGELAERLGLHPLVIEDILNTEQRPKLEDYDDYLFVVLKSMYHVDAESGEPEIEQISLVLGSNYVLSFQECKGDEFDPIRDRIRGNKGRIRKAGADHLLYALIDLIVDQYFAVLGRFGDRIELLEEELVADPMTETLRQIHHLK